MDISYGPGQGNGKHSPSNINNNISNADQKEEEEEEDSFITGIQSWHQLEAGGEIPSPRCWFGYCSIGKLFYIFGGYTGKKIANSFLDDLYCLNLGFIKVFNEFSYFFKRPNKIETLEWTFCKTQGEIPYSRYANSLTVIDSKTICLFGGSSGRTYHNSFYFLDTETFTWTKIQIRGSQLSQRCAHTVAVVGKRLFIHGGDHGMGQYLDDLHILDLEKMAMTSPKISGKKPLSRGWHSVIALGKDLYYFGGCNESKGNSYFNDIWIFRTTTMEWEYVEIQNQNLPPARYSHSCIAVGNNLAILGGKYKDGGSIEIYWFNIEKRIWWQPHVEGKKPSNRYAHGTAIYDGKIYLFGGFDGYTAFNDLYSLEIDLEKRSRTYQRPSSSLATHLKQLLNSEVFSDITFLVEGKKLYAHKNILVCRCTYFRNMFLSKMKEASQNEIVLTGITYHQFLAFLTYVYTEQIDMDVNGALDLLSLANLYQFDELKKDLTYIIERYMGVDNCCTIYQHAHHNCAPDLEHLCLQFISKNLDVVQKSLDWKNLDNDLISNILFHSKKLDSIQ